MSGTNTRIPDRFEQHDKQWWIFCPPYVVDGKTEYAMGGYGSRKAAEQAWSSLCRCVRVYDRDYGREIDAVPADYIPCDSGPHNHVSARAARKRRRTCVEANTSNVVAEFVPCERHDANRAPAAIDNSDNGAGIPCLVAWGSSPDNA